MRKTTRLFRLRGRAVSKLKIFVGFVPWIAFSLIASRPGPQAVLEACLVALLVAVGLLAVSVSRRESPKVLEVTGAVVFLALGVASFLAPGVDAFVAAYGQALSALVLAAVIFLLLPVMPFTEQYARESVPREYWHSPVFRATNRRISAAWGGVVAGMAVCHALAGALLPTGAGETGGPAELVLNWVVPGLLLWFAVQYTRRTADAAHDHAVAHRPAHEAGPAAPRR